MDDGRFGSIVCRLQLGEVDDVAAHRSRRNEAAVSEVGQLVTIGVGTLLLLSAPVGGGGSGAVKRSIKVNADDIAVMFKGAVHHRALGPGNTGVGNKNIQTAIELRHDSVDSLLNGLRIGDLNLISFGCAERVP